MSHDVQLLRAGWGWIPVAGIAAAVLLGGCSDEAASPPALAVVPAEIQLVVGDSAAVLEVRNGGQGVLTWELREDAPWLAADPAAGSTAGAENVTLHVLPDSLPHGPHIATVTVTSNGGSADARVRMWEGFAAQPDTLHLVAGQLPGEVVLTRTQGNLSLAWTVGGTGEWLQVEPSGGTLGAIPETLLVAIDHAGLTPGSYSALLWIDGEAFGADTVRVMLAVPQTAAVAGRVYYLGTLIPVAGVRVSIGAIADTTDADGGYALAAVPLGGQVLVAEREGFTPVQEAITLAGEGLSRDLSIASQTYTYRITGRLTQSLGDGLVNATVTLLNPDNTGSDITTRSREAGAYTLERVPPGARRLRFTALHYQPLLVDVEVAAGDVVRDARAVAALVGPPEPLSGPAVARWDCGRVRVSWTPGILAGLETVAGYRVERAPAAAGPFADAGGLIAGASTTHFDDTDLGTQKVYYRVLTETIDGDPGPPGLASSYTPAPWVQLAPEALPDASPEERWGQAAVCDPQEGRPRMLVIGGTGCESGTCGIDFGDVWALDLADLSWEQLDDGTGPADRNEHSVVLEESRRRVVLFGGKLGEGDHVYRDTWAFGLETRSWVRLHDGQDPDPEATPAARSGHTAVLDAAGDRMLVYGGRATSVFNDVWAFDLTTHQWSRLRSGQHGELDPQPEARVDHVAVFDPIGRRMIVHGGLSGSSVNATLSDTWAFELDGATWSRLPDGPQRCRHMIDYDPLEHRGVFAGGWTYGGGGQSSGRFNDIWVFDLAADEWRELAGGDEAGRPEKRDRHSMVLRPDNGALYIFGGLLELSGLGADAWTFCAGER